MNENLAEYPTQKDYEIYISKNEEVKFDVSLYEKDKALLNAMKTLFCQDIDVLLNILESQKDFIEIPRVQALFRTLFNSGMFHLQKVSRHMEKISEDNDYILKEISREIINDGRKDI